MNEDRVTEMAKRRTGIQYSSHQRKRLHAFVLRANQKPEGGYMRSMPNLEVVYDQQHRVELGISKEKEREGGHKGNSESGHFRSRLRCFFQTPSTVLFASGLWERPLNLLATVVPIPSPVRSFSMRTRLVWDSELGSRHKAMPIE